MKKIIFTLALFCGVIHANSQSFILSNDLGTNIPNQGLITVDCAANASIVMLLNVKNVSNQTKNVMVKKYVLQNLVGSTITFCFGICVDETTMISPYSLPLAAGATTSYKDGNEFTVDFEGNNHVGTALVAYTVFNENDVNDSIMVKVQFNSGNTGINDNENKSVSLNFYPNPAKNNIHVSSKDLVNGDVIEIRSITGKTLITSNGINEKSGYININTEILNPGIYMISVVRNSQIIKTQKLIID